jgi:Anti-sigma factor NepR
MGERGKTDDIMKNRKINLEAVEPDMGKTASDKPQTQDAMGTQANVTKPHARLGREVQAKIGQQLRAMYDDVVNQGVPSHIVDLVRRLSEQD